MKQIVPNESCLECDVCCRFPEKTSFLAPIFSEHEMEKAAAAGAQKGWFKKTPDGRSCRIEPQPHGETHICPCFDPATHRCRIYDARPFDCQLYPFALMYDATCGRVVLGIDTKCPFVRNDKEAGNFNEFAEYVARFVESPAQVQALTANQSLIQRYQEDVIVIRELPELSARIKKHAAGSSLNKLSLSDKHLFDENVRASSSRLLSGYAFPAVWVWTDIFDFYWIILDERLCLFAEHGGNCFMPLPPLGETPTEEVLSSCFELMHRRSRSPSAVRIENVPGGLKDRLASFGHKVILKGVEYVYERDTLAKLSGRRFKSKREPYNHFVKHHRPVYRPYLASDLDACRKLFARWSEMRRLETEDNYYRALLEDASFAHERGLKDADALGLQGRVVLISGEVKGYTFGYPLTNDTFCVLFEITDLTVKGLSQYIFREFCREMSGYRYVNTLDDSGLENLKCSKLSYRPSTLEPSYTIVPKEGASSL